MKITFDPAKRPATWQLRGLDFADAPLVFAGPVLEIEDDRQDYRERRIQTIGWLDGQMVMVVDAARGRYAAHHLDEALQQKRKNKIWPPNIPMTP